jgi:drug/metabolite transporter (DMT)-like permease
MLSSIVAMLFLGERPGVFGVLGITAIGSGIFLLTGGLQRNANPMTRAAILAGLLTGTSIATYTVWDKYAVSVVHVSPILLDLPYPGSVVNSFGLEPAGRSTNVLEAISS